MTGYVKSFSDKIEELFSVQGIVYIASLVSLLFAAAALLFGGEALRQAELLDIPQFALSEATSAIANRGIRKAEEYQVIASRNIFGAQPAPVTPLPTTNVQRPKLRLVGTNAGSAGTSIAIIEDQNKNEQDVFELNESVFGNGRLIEILPEKVKLQYSDRIDTLEIEEGSPSSGGGAAPSSESSEGQTDYVVAEQEVTDALANLPMLLSQARAVPYFRNGQSIGMRLFAIRSGSLYEKLGLKNGDIITAVNDSSLSDPAQALKLFEQLKSERSITVKMERNGEARDAHYSIR